MLREPYIDLRLALLLAESCGEAYNQLQRDGQYTPSPGFEPLMGFKASSVGEPEWFGYIARSKDTVMVVFRGTVTDRDWVADAEFFQMDYPYAGGKLRTHTGFTRLYCTCRDEIMRVLLDQPDTLSLLITGHSLGAALAVLFAMDADQSTSFRETIMYTFAGPRTGNRSFARAFNKQGCVAVRVVNVHDVVPRLPPSYIEMPESKVGLRYQHVGREFSFSVQTGSVKGNHEIATYIHEIRRLSESSLDGTRALRLGTYEHPPLKACRARRRSALL